MLRTCICLYLVERRRKDKINNWISKLADVVPQCSWGKQVFNLITVLFCKKSHLCWQAVFHLDAGWPVGSASRPVNLLLNIYITSQCFAPNLSLPKVSMGYVFISTVVFQCNGAWWLLLTGFSSPPSPTLSTCRT